MVDQDANVRETARGSVERLDPTKAQRAAARRAAESKATIPHHYFQAEARNGSAAAEFIVHAAATALREFPVLNGAYRDGALERYSRVNVGVAVPAPEAAAVPTVFDADAKDPAAIAAELDRLRERAAAGELTSPELAGGTFTVTLLGARADSLLPVVNHSQAGILAVGALRDRATVVNGRLAVASTQRLTLACDARIVGEVDGAGFVDRVRALLERSAATKAE